MQVDKILRIPIAVSAASALSAVAVGDMDPAFRLMHAVDTLSLLRMVFCATKLNHDIIKSMNYEL